MKFRDPKTGDVFEDIESAYSEFCCGRYCGTDCTLNVFKECGNWATNHPAEAARLMGFDVVEDKMKVNVDNPEKIRTNFAKIIVSGKREKPYYEIMYFHPEKNELCIGYSSYNLEYVFQWLQDIFEVVEDKDEPMEKKDNICGNCKYTDKEENEYPCSACCHAYIDKFESKPRFTQEELEFIKRIPAAKYMSRDLISNGESTVDFWTGSPTCKGGVFVGQRVAMVPLCFVPSLRPGQAVRLEEIP